MVWSRPCVARSGMLLVFATLVLVPGLALAAQGAEPVESWTPGTEVWDAWRIEGIRRHPEFIRYTFVKGSRRTTVEVTARRENVEAKGRFHVVQPAPGQRPPPGLLTAIRRAVRRHEARAFGALLVERAHRGPHGSHGASGRGGPSRNVYERLTANPTLVVQILLVLGLILLALRSRFLGQLARRVPVHHGLALGGWMAVGTALRLLGGIRTPGFTNCSGHAHGFTLLHEILVFDPVRVDSHGAGFHALHKLSTAILPRTEASVIGVQLALSVACIPLTYVVARFFLGRARWALWAAATLAVLPTPVFFAATEIRLVPGTFFLLLSLAALGVGVRDRHPVTLLATVVLGLVATQFYPILMFFPGAMLLLLLSGAEGRALLRVRWAQVAAVLFVLAWLVPAGFMAHLVATRSQTVVGGDFLNAFRELDRLFVPGVELARDRVYNVFLHAAFTPVTFSALAVVGLVVGGRRRDQRWPVAAVLASALLLTFPGFFIGRMNLARLQQAAQPFYAMLVGIGLAALVQLLTQRVERLRWLGWVAAVAVVLGSVALWPGAIGARFTLQHERRAFLEALPNLEDGCRVIWAPGRSGQNHGALPTYLARWKKPKMHFEGLPTTTIPPGLRPRKGTCLYYYRASHCFTELPRESRRFPLRPGCVQVEAQLELRPVFTKRIPAAPDDVPNYLGETLLIGFYRVVSVRGAGAPKTGAGKPR